MCCTCVQHTAYTRQQNQHFSTTTHQPILFVELSNPINFPTVQGTFVGFLYNLFCKKEVEGWDLRRTHRTPNNRQICDGGNHFDEEQSPLLFKL
jgi:hypothetical protein